jgi:hydrogenase expression/formation protein HypC
MRIVSVVGQIACCEARGTCREINLALLAEEDMAVGDHVLVHAGCALRRITATDARLTWDLLDEIIAALELAGA